MALPNISCSNCYFPSGMGASIHGSSNISRIVVKGGGGFFLTNVGLRPYIPIAGMKFNAGTQAYEYLTVAQNIADMGNVVLKWFISALNASTNYALDLPANPDKILLSGSDENFFAYLYKRINTNSFMGARYNYIANLVYNFWLNADPAWTTAQYENAIRQLKLDLVQVLADPNLYPINALEVDAASVLAVAITTFKGHTAALAGFECVEISLI